MNGTRRMLYKVVSQLPMGQNAFSPPVRIVGGRQVSINKFLALIEQRDGLNHR